MSSKVHHGAREDQVPRRALLAALGGGLASAGLLTTRSAAAGTTTSGGIQLQPLGGGQDDWPTLMAVAAEYAYKQPLVLLPGAGGAPWLCKSLGRIPNGTTIIGTSGTMIVQSLPAGTGNALVCAFGNTYAGLGVSTQLAASSKIGTATLSVSSNVCTVGQYIIVINAASGTFRQALYRVVAISGTTITVDRPVRMQFDPGDVLFPTLPVRDISIQGNGMTMTGTGARHIELLGALNCYISDVNFNSSQGTVDERFISLDVPSFNCVAERLTGDGGGVTTLGMSFESAEGCVYRDCLSQNCQYAGYIFQDAQNCLIDNCKAYGIAGAGVVFTAAPPSLAGANSNNIVGGDFSRNGTGIRMERGSSMTKISGATVTGNTGDGILFAADASKLTSTEIAGCVIQENTNGVTLSSSAVGSSIVNSSILSNTNGVLVPTGSTDTQLWGVNLSGNLLPLHISAYCQLTSVSGTVTNPTASSAILLGTGANVLASGVSFTTPQTPTGLMNVVLALAGAVASIDGAQFNIGTSSNAIVVVGAGAVLSVRNTTVTPTGSASGTTGIFASAGTVRLEGAVNTDACGTPLSVGSSGYCSLGTIQVNGPTPIAVAWPNLKSTDFVSLTRTVAGGVPGPTPTVSKAPGAHFTVVATAGDTSTYSYSIGLPS